MVASFAAVPSEIEDRRLICVTHICPPPHGSEGRYLTGSCEHLDSLTPCFDMTTFLLFSDATDERDGYDATLG